MRPIDAVYICTCERDYHWARALVASIRHYHPEVPISLIVDGPLDSSELQRAFEVDRLPTGERPLGFGFGKFEPLFLTKGHRFLILDADIVFLGPLLDRLATREEDFVFEETPIRAFQDGEIGRNYFDLEALAELDPDYHFPGWIANTGQWVGTAGLIEREEISKWMRPDWPEVLHPEVFLCGEQGLWNYLVQRLAQDGRITIGREAFMHWCGVERLRPRIRHLVFGTPTEPALMHWAGAESKKPTPRRAPKGYLFARWERAYRRQVQRFKESR